MTVPSTPSAAIEIEGLSKVYRKGKNQVTRAVDMLDLSIPAGQIFGFLGANGAGKTTTIKMICGLVIPTTGRIHVNGYSVTRERWMAMRQIGAVLEGTRNIYWRFSAWENLMYFARLKGYRAKHVEHRARKLLQELDLWDQRNQEVRAFSRGMQQKVAIACALIADPPIILLDEPTLGLDIHAARTVKAWIQQLAHEEGKTIILTTHQLDMAQAVCDQIAIMRKGILLANQPLDQLLRRLLPQECYQIKVQGSFREQQAAQFPNLSVEREDDITILSGAVKDQAALQSTLTKIQQLDLTLLSVMRTEPNLEDVFVSLVEGAKEGVTDANHLAGTV